MKEGDSLLAEFETAVREVIEPVIHQAGFEWNPSGLVYHKSANQATTLFEAKPPEFMRRFPRLAGHYGDYGPTCVDLWIRYYFDRRSVEADVEAVRDVSQWLREHGHPMQAEALQTPNDVEVAVRFLSEALRTMLSEAEDA
jgi:hypothetical protein